MTVRDPGRKSPDEASSGNEGLDAIFPGVPANYDAPDIVTAVYQYTFRLLEWRWLKGLTGSLSGLFRRCTPEFAESFKLPPGRGTPGPRVDVAIILAAMFFCLGMTAVLAALSNTWWPSSEPGVLHWASDHWNIFLYAVVCPLYVWLCLRLLVLSIERPVTAASSMASPPAVLRLFVSTFLIILFSSVLITSYVSDAANPAIVRYRYWFFDELNGVRFLNAAGLYYIVLNFSLLVVTFVGAASFIAISIDGMTLARALTHDAPAMGFESFRNQIDRLVRAYRLGVGLVFCYAINLIVWKFSPLGPTGNLQIAGALFTLVGLFFVAVPRRFVQHLWAEYCVRRAQATGEPCDGEVYRDVVSSRDRRLLGILQLVCIGGWFDVFYDIPMNPAHYIGWLFRS